MRQLWRSEPDRFHLTYFTPTMLKESSIRNRTGLGFFGLRLVRTAGPLLWLCLWLMTMRASALDESDSLIFRHPSPGTVISGDELVIEVEVLGGAHWVEFTAHHLTSSYQPDDAEMRRWAAGHLLYRDTAAPFEYIWDISSIPDHAHHRLSIAAKAYRGDRPTMLKETWDMVVDRSPTPARPRSTSARFVRRLPRRLRSRDSVVTFGNGNNQVAFAAFWSPESLALLVQVEDDSVVVADTMRHSRSSYWFGDDLEVFIDAHNRKSPLHDSTQFQILCHPHGYGYAGHVGLRDSVQVPAAVSGATDSSGYHLRITLPWSALGRQARPGMALGLDVHNTDRDKAGGIVTTSTWLGLNLANHQNASEWGRLVLKRRGSALPWILAVLTAALLGTAGAVFIRLRTSRAEPTSAGAADGPQSGLAPASVVTQAMLDEVAANLHDDTLGLKSIADKLGRSPKYLSDLFRKDTGRRFSDYLAEQRLNQARELLRSTQRPISQVAIQVGYSSHRYFSAAYRKHFGVSPSADRLAARRG